METAFKDTKIGRIPDDWDLCQIKDIAVVNAGQSPSSFDCNDEGKGIPFFQGNSDFGYKYPRINSWTTKSTKIAQRNDILMSVRAPVGEINFADTACCIGRGLCAITPKSRVNLHFLYYMLISSMPRLLRFQQGSTFLAVNRENIDTHLILLPPLPEQRKIAEILSRVDETIEKTDAIIEETQQLKRGLMQRLFTRGIGHSRFKETKIGLIPEEWRAIQIGDFSIIRRGASPRPIRDPKYFAQNGRGWVRIADVTSSGKKLRKTLQYLSELGASRSVPVNPGDLIMSICATIGKPIVVDMEACIHDGFILFSQFHRAASADYMYYLLQLLECSFIAKGQEGTQKNLNTNLVRKTHVPLPPLDEQHKIAEILSEVDTKIETEQAFKSELEQLKTGLMQVLLTGQVRVKV